MVDYGFSNSPPNVMRLYGSSPFLIKFFAYISVKRVVSDLRQLIDNYPEVKRFK